MRLHRTRGSAELRELAFDSAMQGLWLINGKMGSQVSGIDKNDFLGGEQMGKLGEEEGEPAIERRREYTDLSEREEQVVCHASALALALAMIDEARGEAEM